MILKELEYLYYKIPDYKITEHLSIKHPTYKEIKKFGESKYIEQLYMLCTMPDDHKSMLYDLGVHWYKVDELTWFNSLFRSNVKEICDLIFNINITDYYLHVNVTTEELTIYNPYYEEELTIGHIKLIREHLNSMIGYIYKEHKETPMSTIEEKMLIDNERQKINNSINSVSDPVSIRDVISNLLMDKYFKENMDEKNFKDIKDNNTKILVESSFRLGEIDVIKRFAANMYRELIHK